MAPMHERCEPEAGRHEARRITPFDALGALRKGRGGSG
jgi:hypothetical protein